MTKRVLKGFLAVSVALILISGSMPIYSFAVGEDVIASSESRDADSATNEESDKAIENADDEDAAKKSEETYTDESETESEEGSAAATESDEPDTTSPAGNPQKRVIKKVVVPDPDGDAYITYKFYNDENTLVRTQIVKEGDTLYQPETPKSKDGKKFIGWYEKGSDTPFDGFGVVKEVSQDQSISLYARFSDNSVLVTYHDEDGRIISCEEYAEGTEIEIRPQYPIVSVDSLKSVHVGWTLEKGSKETLPREYTLGDKDIDLYPVIMNGYKVSFDTRGGTYIKDQFLLHDSAESVLKAKKPESDPGKTGYVFDGWYTDESCSTEFDFDTEIKEPTTIYAGWSPSTETPYTVVYWEEAPVKGTSTVFEYRRVAVKEYKGTTGEDTQYDKELVFDNPVNLVEEGYCLDEERSKAVEIAADGSSVMNVYYERKEFTVRFTNIPDRDGNTYELSMTGKYGTSISSLWEEMDRRSGLDNLFSAGHFVQQEHINSPEDLDAILHYDLDNLVYRTQGPLEKWDRLFYQALPDATEEDGKKLYENTSARVLYGTVTDDRLYHLYRTSGFNAGMNACILYDNTWTGFNIRLDYSDGNTGRTRYNDILYYGAWYNAISGALLGVDNRRIDEGGIHYSYRPSGVPDSPNPDVYYDTDGFLDIYFFRNKYDISFETFGGPEIDPAKVYYEEKMTQYEPEDYIVGETKRTLEDGHVLTFGGWYSDSRCTTEFDFSDAMPASDIVAYAKWVPSSYTVTFDSNGGSEIEAQEEVEYGKQAVKPEDPTYEGKRFLGWTLDKEPYDFTEAVFSDIRLVANWKDDSAYTVSYDLNGGSGKAPEDNNQYFGDANARVKGASTAIAPKGKVFVCWTADDTGDEYYPGDMIEINNRDIVLRARWEDAPGTTKLIYDFNFERFGISGISAGRHDSVSNPNLSHNYVVKSGVMNNGVIKLEDIKALMDEKVKGYRFVGWHLKRDCSDELLTEIRVNDLDQDNNIVYAEWKKIPSDDSSDKENKPDERKTVNPPDDDTPSKTNPPEKSTGIRKSPRTSDDVMLITWLAMLAMSAVVLIGMLLIKRRDAKNNSHY